MRLFLAIELPEPVRLKLASLSRNWQQRWDHWKASWVRPENLHVTLKFLGEVAEPEVAKLCVELRAVRIPDAIRLSPDRIECLPPNGAVRVICAGLTGDLDLLGGLHRQIEQRCEPMGFARERRKFRPHVTLARLKEWLPPYTRKALADASMPHLPAPEFSACEFVLMQSQLHPQESKYIRLARFPFGR